MALNSTKVTTPLRNLYHLEPKTKNAHFPYFANSRLAHRPKWVPPKDRIKWWNITPGDKVRMITGRKEFKAKDKLEVIAVDREKNYVYLKDGPINRRHAPTLGDPETPNYNEVAAPVHYSNVQLWIGDFEFPPLPGQTETRTLPVYATRLSTTPPYYSRALRRFMWTRYAANTVPDLPPKLDEEGKVVKLEIPWPKREPKKIPDPGPRDTEEEEVLKVTWVPPPPTLNPGFRKPGEPSLEDMYLRSADPSHPIEHFVYRELSNPLSRAKRTKRWQQSGAIREARFARFLRREVRESAELEDGRSPKEIRFEAQWKFERREEERGKRRGAVRRERSGVTARAERKAKRKALKKAKTAKRLKTIVLKPAKNQVIPGGTPLPA